MKMLNISANPHVRSNVTTAGIMRDVLIAMIPTALFGIWQWGINSALVIIFTTIFAVLSEFLYEKALKLPVTISDYSAAVTGLILALNCPPGIPVWIPCLGSVFAIIVVKQLYGGLGKNWMNPALAARCFLLISFAGKMTAFQEPGFNADAISGATPLAVMKAGGSCDIVKLFIGTVPGTIGEVSKICLLIGALYLVYRKVISLRIPLTYIGTTFLFTLIFGSLLSGRGFDLYYCFSEILGGGLIFGAFFMATDYVTSPITEKGQYLFGIILGILTGLFRIYGGSSEGVSYAIILTNIVVPAINNATIPKAFGREGE